MAGHICPWWFGFVIDNRLRRLIHRPEQILAPLVQQGMTAVDVGCGMGFFSIPMAGLVGESGKVVAVDLQQKMLDTLMRRAERAGVARRIEPHLCQADDLGLDASADFALAFAMVHETPDASRLLAQIHECLKPGARLLVAEPQGHVSARRFREMIDTARGLGYEPSEPPSVRFCHAVVLAVRCN